MDKVQTPSNIECYFQLVLYRPIIFIRITLVTSLMPLSLFNEINERLIVNYFNTADDCLITSALKMQRIKNCMIDSGARCR
jgi:hypothetical protein